MVFFKAFGLAAGIVTGIFVAVKVAQGIDPVLVEKLIVNRCFSVGGGGGK